MARPADYIGKRFKTLTIVKYSGTQNKQIVWLCKCDCGKEILCTHDNLIRVKVVSCGCIKDPNSFTFKEAAKKRIFSFIEIINECWIWKGSIRDNGVSYTSYRGHQLNPVKFFHELENSPLGKNWYFTRKCTTKNCVNPNHHILTNVSKTRYKNIRNKDETTN